MMRSSRCLSIVLALAGVACTSPASSPLVSPTAGPAASAEPAPPAPAESAAPPASAEAPSAPPESKFPKSPPELQVPPNSSLVLKARGKGVQIYECAGKPDDAKAFAWKLKAPEADLFDDRGQKVARHFAGPSWEANDRSSAVGTVLAKADAPDADAVPWLLLRATAKGPGLFEHVLHVQRLDTSGGKAPASGCDASKAKTNAEARVPYEATYYFYSLTPGSK